MDDCFVEDRPAGVGRLLAFTGSTERPLLGLLPSSKVEGQVSAIESPLSAGERLTVIDPEWSIDLPGN